MAAKRLSAVALIAAVLALPGTALADSAGDNQYQDPFSNVPTQQKHQNKSGSTTTPAPTTNPAPTTQAPASTAPAAPVSSASTDPAATKTLPRTGFPLLPVAAIGAALIAAGFTLRRLASR